MCNLAYLSLSFRDYIFSHYPFLQTSSYPLVFYIIFIEINLNCRPYSCEANFKIGPSKCERKCLPLIEIQPLLDKDQETIVHFPIVRVSKFDSLSLSLFTSRKKELQSRPCSSKGTPWVHVVSSTFPLSIVILGSNTIYIYLR